MSREQLVNFLADLVEHGHLTVAEARVVLARFDAGENLNLPLLLPESTPRQKESRWNIGWVTLFLLLGGSLGSKLTSAQRRRGQGLLRAQYQNQVQQLAVGVALGRQTVATWQVGMMAAVANYTAQMTIAGAGTLPNAGVQGVIDERIDAQAPYLDRFATQIAARQIVGREMSTVAIAARADKYGGNGWGAYYLGQSNQAAGDYGYVERWETKDDGHVCKVCRPRDGQYFLPGLGPMPGWDCLGTCRCRRVLEYNEAEYLRLIGQPASAITQAQQPLKPAMETAIRKLAPPAAVDRLQRSGPPAPPAPPGPPPTPAGTGQPQGRPVSTALVISSRNPITAPAQEAMAAVDSVHGDGDLPPLPVVPALMTGAQGKYTERNGRPYAILMNPNAEEPRYTLTHEVAHFLDSQQLHMRDDLQFLGWEHVTDNGDPVMGVLPDEQVQWKEAVDGSRAIQELVRLARGEQSSILIGGEPPDLNFANYLLQYDEIWARSYAQYIAVRSGNATLLEELARRLNPNDYPLQWQADDFEAIGQAIDEMLTAKGWRQ